MRFVVEFDSNDAKSDVVYEHITTVFENLNIPLWVGLKLFVPDDVSNIRPIEFSNDEKFRALPFLGRGTRINRARTTDPTRWLVSVNDALIWKTRFSSLNPVVKSYVNEFSKKHKIRMRVKKRSALGVYENMELRVYGTVVAVKINRDYRTGKLLLRVLLKDIYDDCERLLTDHIYICFDSNIDKYIKLLPVGYKVYFTGTVCKYKSDNRYGLQNIKNIKLEE